MIVFGALIMANPFIVLGSFTAKHYSYLAQNLTTIEAIEKINPVRGSAMGPPPLVVRRRGGEKVGPEEEEEKRGREIGSGKSDPNLEASVKLTGNPFDLGWEKNIASVLGSDRFMWIFPVWTTPGNGVNFQYQITP